MKTKMLAVVAVLALAFAGFAVYAEQNDATPTGQISFLPSAPVAILPSGGNTAGTAITLNIANNTEQQMTEPINYTFASDDATIVAPVSTATELTNGQVTVTCFAPGAVTLTFTLTDSTTDTPVQVTDEVTIYVYEHPADAKVIGYAKATVGTELNQVIIYDDGTALFDIGNDLNAQHAYIGVGQERYIVGLSERFTWNFQGIVDVSDISAFEFTLTPDNGTEASLGTFNVEPYAVTFDVNSNADAADFEHAHATGEAAVRTVAITTAETEATTDFELTLEKGAAINAINATVGGADVALSDLIAPVNDPLSFQGFAADNEATSGFRPVATMTIENFIFGLVTETVGEAAAAVETAYATWEIVYFKVWISNGAQTPEYAQGEQTVATSYTVKAPRVAITDDILTIQITQTANATSAYAITFFEVASYNQETGQPVAGEAVTGDFYLRMMTNGIYAASPLVNVQDPEASLPGITGDVIIVVTPSAAGSTTGYQFGMDSVSNTSDIGSAVAKLTVFDAQLAGTITMGGTYYYVEDGARIYGNIQNKINAGQIGYTAVIDGAAVTENPEDPEAEVLVSYDGVLVDSLLANNYAITLAPVEGQTIGFYAVKAILTPASGDAVETEYMLA